MACMRTLDESTENLASNYLKPTPVKQADKLSLLVLFEEDKYV